MEILNYLPRDLLQDKSVFITGGGSGINLGIARNFAALGANVGICGRTSKKLEIARAELEALGARVSTSVADVRDYDEIAKALQECEKTLGAIDCLVCGAAGNFLAPAENMSPIGFKTVIEIDLIGSFNTARAAFDQLKETRGSIIFISAGQTFGPYFAQSHVGAAKAGIDNLMRCLAMEWGSHGIRCNSIVPGPIAGTEGMKRLAAGGYERKWIEAIPLGRFGTVNDIGQMAVFLASPLASYVTGAHIVVDGGQNLPGSGVFGQLISESLGYQ
ncbi:MAG: SDR family oxidoreductase [Gammaproteobacteria bacterium]|nr:SDR family oxidoreductase [Gammaproteobacteria bacterium]